jgi:hypothetical protein
MNSICDHAKNHGGQSENQQRRYDRNLEQMDIPQVTLAA